MLEQADIVVETKTLTEKEYVEGPRVGDMERLSRRVTKEVPLENPGGLVPQSRTHLAAIDPNIL